MATREQPKRTYNLHEAVAFVLEPNSDSDMSDLENSEHDEYVPNTVEREMDVMMKLMKMKKMIY